MISAKNWIVLRAPMLFGLLLLGASGPPANADMVMATLSIEPTGAAFLPGETALFDIFLRGYQPDDDATAIIAFTLDVGASDPLLTGGGADFSRFGFTLDSALEGILGGLPVDDDISDDGSVSFWADTPPFGNETGILASMGDVRLGGLSVLAPSEAGVFGVAFRVDFQNPFFATHFLLDDGGLGFPTLPGDGALAVENSALTVINVVPEPGSLTLFGLGAASFLGHHCLRRIRRRTRAGDAGTASSTSDASAMRPTISELCSVVPQAR